ncbi:MAG: dTDP-glucose 4,6-dehydratase [Acidobacteriota bacterium]
MSKVLVTGGAGFIGSNFVRLLVEETSFEIVVLDKLTYAGHLESLEPLLDGDRVHFVRGDIGSARDVRTVFAEHGPFSVVNFAAESHVDRSIDSPGDFVQTNVTGTFELLDAFRHQGSGRFLHVSTDEVFGSLGPDGAFVETTPYDPSSPYSASKAAADHLVRAYHRTFGVDAVITNCSNNYGPYQLPEKLIPLMILNAAEGLDLPIYGDGSNVRDWLHVEDHCRGILAALERGRAGDSYNLGGLSERNNVEVVDAVCAALENYRPAAENEALEGRSYADLKTFVSDRPGHDQRYAIDPSKAQAELDWGPTVTFEEGLRQTVRWYLDNGRWCQAVQTNATRNRIGLADDEAS